MCGTFHSLDGEIDDIRELDEGILLEHIGSFEATENVDETEGALIIGDPDSVKPLWRADRWADDVTCGSCAVLWGEGSESLDRQTGMKRALDSGVFVPDCGVCRDDLAAVCEIGGGTAEVCSDLSIGDLMEMLENYDGVLCSVCGAALDNPALLAWPGLDADRVMILAGVDIDDPANVRVLLMDAETGEDRVSLDLDLFLDVWRPGGCMAVGVSA